MEQNAARRIIFLSTLSLIVTFTSCIINKGQEDASVKGTAREHYRNIEKINILIEDLSEIGCGKARTNSVTIHQFYNSNMDLFYCLKHGTAEQKDKFRSVMNEITPLLNYQEDTGYIRFLGHIKTFDDPKSFSIAIDLLQYDYEPEHVPNSDVHFAPVRQYVLNQLVLPHVYSINGDINQAGSMEYKELMMKYHVFMSTEEFHQYVRELWENGAIVLKSQVDD